MLILFTSLSQPFYAFKQLPPPPHPPSWLQLLFFLLYEKAQRRGRLFKKLRSQNLRILLRCEALRADQCTVTLYPHLVFRVRTVLYF